MYFIVYCVQTAQYNHIYDISSASNAAIELLNEEGCLTNVPMLWPKQNNILNIVVDLDNDTGQNPQYPEIIIICRFHILVIYIIQDKMMGTL